MLQKNRRIATGKHTFLWGMITALCVVGTLWCQSIVSLADSTGTVIPGSANIREKADASSGVVGSAAAGATVSIKGEVQDGSGTLWYEVYVNANTTGYIRADLVDKKDGGTSSQSGGGQGSAGGASAEAENAMDAQYATVAIEAIKVRTAPSTSDAVVGRLTRDEQVVVSGQSNGNDGKMWYYVTFTGTDGAEKTGFIRSDLLTLGDMVPVSEEEEQPEEPEQSDPEPDRPVNNDYELTYEQEDGTYEWYLYDYTEGEHGSRQKLQVLLDAAKSKGEDTEADAKTLVRQRIAIVVLAIVAVLLLIVVIVMALRLRDVYYEDYEDDEDDEDEDDEEDDEEPEQEEEQPVGRRRRVQEDETEAPRRRRMQEEEGTLARRRSVEEEELPEERPARKKPVREERRGGMREVTYQDDGAGSIVVNTAPKRKAKNFLLDDDDFEFEFLNMDDKDL